MIEKVSFKTKRGKVVSFNIGGPKKRRVMSSFVKAAKKVGYMKPGAEFKRLPKKGSREYKKIMSVKKDIESKRR